MKKKSKNLKQRKNKNKNDKIRPAWMINLTKKSTIKIIIINNNMFIHTEEVVCTCLDASN